MAVEVERLIVTLEARLDGYNKGLTQAQADTNKKLAAMEARYQQMASRLKASASTAALGIGGALAGIGAYLSVDKVIEYADAWTRVRRALEQNSKIFGVQLISAEKLNDVASDTRQDLESLSKLYIRASSAVQEMGRSNDDAVKAVSAFSKALVLGQASASEQKTAIEQFSQALSKGKLDGDEFRTMMESASVVSEALARHFGVARGALLEMARSGKIVGKDIIKALVDIEPEIDRLFQSAPKTIGEGLTVLNNSVTKYIGKLNEASRATDGLGQLIYTLGKNMDTVAGVALTMAAALVAPFGGAALGNVAAFAARMMTLPGFILGSVVALETLGRNVNLNLEAFSNFSSAGVDMGASLGLAMTDVGKSATTLTDQFHGLLSIISDDLLSAINVLTNAIGGQDVTWQDVAAAALVAIGAIVGGVKATIHLVSTGFRAVPLIIEAAFKGAVNKASAAMQAIIDAVADGINNMIAIANKIPKVKIDFIVAPKLGGYDNTAVAELEKLSEQITKQVQKDFDLKGLAGDINQRAKFAALNRVIKGYNLDPAKDKTPRKNPGEKDKRSEYDREVAGIEKKTAALQAELVTIGQSTYAQTKAKAVAELTFAAQQAAAKEGKKYNGEHEQQINRVADAYAKAEARAAFFNKLNDASENIKALRDEVDLIGLQGRELEQAKVQQELLNEARRTGAEIGPEERRRIEELAEETAAMKQKLAIINDIRDQSREALKGFISDLREGKSATEALGNALDRIADKLIDMAVDGLVESALGGLKGGIGGGGAGGASILSLFGFAGGGVMTGQGPRSLPRFAKGGVSRSAAIFGEAGPEAAVPLPDGRRIPVDLRMPSIPQAVTPSSAPSLSLSVSINAPNSTAESVGKLQSDLVPQIRNVVRTEVNEMFSRSQRFTKSGL